MKIGNQVRRLRFEHGEMTQQALAEVVGATRQTVLAIEAGKVCSVAGAGVSDCGCVRGRS